MTLSSKFDETQAKAIANADKSTRDHQTSAAILHLRGRIRAGEDDAGSIINSLPLLIKDILKLPSGEAALREALKEEGYHLDLRPVGVIKPKPASDATVSSDQTDGSHPRPE